MVGEGLRKKLHCRSDWEFHEASLVFPAFCPLLGETRYSIKKIVEQTNTWIYIRGKLSVISDQRTEWSSLLIWGSQRRFLEGYGTQNAIQDKIWNVRLCASEGISRGGELHTPWHWKLIQTYGLELYPFFWWATKTWRLGETCPRYSEKAMAPHSCRCEPLSSADCGQRAWSPLLPFLPGAQYIVRCGLRLSPLPIVATAGCQLLHGLSWGPAPQHLWVYLWAMKMDRDCLHARLSSSFSEPLATLILEREDPRDKFWCIW